MTPRLSPILTLLTLTLTPHLGWAAGGGDEHHGFPWIHLAASMVNLAIFLVILWKYALPKVRAFFAERRAKLVFSLGEAKRMREEAERHLEEVMVQAASFGAEREALLEKYEAQGRAEKDRIVEEAKLEVIKLRSNAERLIAQETKKAIANIERQAIDRAVELAKETAKRTVDQGSTQDVLVEQYIQDLKRIKPRAS